MHQTSTHPSSLQFSLEDEEQLAYRLGMSEIPGCIVSSCANPTAATGHVRRRTEHAEETRSRQECDRVLRFEYLGL